MKDWMAKQEKERRLLVVTVEDRHLNGKVVVSFPGIEGQEELACRERNLMTLRLDLFLKVEEVPAEVDYGCSEMLLSGVVLSDGPQGQSEWRDLFRTKAEADAFVRGAEAVCSMLSLPCPKVERP